MKFCQKLVCLSLLTLFFLSVYITIITRTPEDPFIEEAKISDNDLLFQMPASIFQVLAEQEVEGWGYNCSRDANIYANVSPLILPSNFCRQQCVMVIMVHSAPCRRSARNSIRRSWGQPNNTLENNATLYFLLAVPPNTTLQEEIAAESERFGDIIQENFTDSYNNLTIKSLLMLKLFGTFCATSAEFLLKADDDTLINLSNILQFLSSVHSQDLLIGRVVNQYKPIRTTDSKWYMPFYLYPYELYPKYLGGSAYLMSVDVAIKLYQMALETPLLHIEDVFFTGVCAEKAKIKLQNSNFFFCELKSTSDLQLDCLKNFLAVTDVTAANISRLYFVLSEMKWWSMMV